MVRTMKPSPGLHLLYRFRPLIGLEAALPEEYELYGDQPFVWTVSRVPSLREAAEAKGELEAIIAARDAAVNEAINTAEERELPMIYEDKYPDVIHRPHASTPKPLTDVHTRHCCINHGCKYGDKDCTVITGKAEQEFPCEYCSYDPSTAWRPAEAEMVGVVAVTEKPSWLRL